MESIRVVVPAVSDDEASAGLRVLTGALAHAGYTPAQGLFGGADGYGALFSNAVFSMHPFCWCDRDDCAWCQPCTCPDESYHYFVAGKEVTYDEWEAATPQPYDRSKDLRSNSHTPTCHWCTSEELKRSNFEHPASGTKINWYKYIGRGMDVDLRASWTNILAECLASIEPLPLDGTRSITQ
jgi:hypothetical protein